MAKQQVIFTDGNELVLLLKGKGGREPYQVQSESIQRISFAVVEEGLLNKLLHKPMRRITVIVKGLGTILFDENKHKRYFDQYIEELRAYCQRNHVTFYDFK